MCNHSWLFSAKKMMELTAAEVLYEAKATENRVWKLFFALSKYDQFFIFYSIKIVGFFLICTLLFCRPFTEDNFFRNVCSAERLLQIKDSRTFQQKVALRKWTVNQMIFYYD